MAIDHIDTRALVRHIRDKGAMRACLSTTDSDAESVIEKARNSPPMENRELASVVTTKQPYEFAGGRPRALSCGLLRLWREDKFAARAGAGGLSRYRRARLNAGAVKSLR